MRRLVPLLIACSIVALGLSVWAAPSRQVSCEFVDCTYSYFPIVGVPSPTPLPPTATPVPPPLASIVIQPSQVSSSYTIDAFREFTNAEAAKNYADPDAAQAAFEAQGRESSWIADYASSSLNPFRIDSQGIRYLTPEGADAGLDYAVVEVQAEHPAYESYAFSGGDRAVAFRWGLIDHGKAYYWYYFIVRKGRYVAVAQTFGYQADLTFAGAASYARKAESRLP